MNPKSRVKQATILASVGAQAIAAFSLSAQDTVTVAGDDLICIDCVITLDTVVTIGGLDGPGLDVIQQSSKVAVDRQGRILVYWSRVPRISVFDSTGVFLRTIGGPGEGPGEYALVVHVDAGPRYIHVFDMRRRTLLDYEFVPVRADVRRQNFPRRSVTASRSPTTSFFLPTCAHGTQSGTRFTC